MAFDNEPETVAIMDKYLRENGYVNDFTDERHHHEIYLSDPRKVTPEKCKTVIRHPIRKSFYPEVIEPFRFPGRLQAETQQS